MTKQYVFITGCPRSGTSGMWSILSKSPDIVIGNEWFAGSAATLDPNFFTAERMFAPRFGIDCGYDIETHPDTAAYVPLAKERHPTARFVGDKIPYLYRHLDHLAAHFPGARVIYMVRDILDVAASYQRRANNSRDSWTDGVAEAIRDWNESLEALANIPPGIEVMPVHFRRFYQMGEILPVLLWLRLDVRDVLDAWTHSSVTVIKGIAKQRKSLSPHDIARINVDANVRLYEAILSEHAKARFEPLHMPEAA